MLAALLAGCGSGGSDGGDPGDYVRAVNTVQDRFNRALAQAQSTIATPTASATQERRALGRLRQAVDAAVAALRRAKAPGDVAGPHRELIEALDAYGPVIAARRAASGLGNPRELLSASTSFANGSEAVNTRVQRAIDAINAKL